MGRFAIMLPVRVVASILEIASEVSYVPARKSLVIFLVQLIIKEVDLGNVPWLNVINTKHFSLWVCCKTIINVKVCSFLGAIISKQFKKLDGALSRLKGLTIHTVIGCVRRVKANVFFPEHLVLKLQDSPML